MTPNQEPKWIRLPSQLTDLPNENIWAGGYINERWVETKCDKHWLMTNPNHKTTHYLTHPAPPLPAVEGEKESEAELCLKQLCLDRPEIGVSNNLQSVYGKTIRYTLKWQSQRHPVQQRDDKRDSQAAFLISKCIKRRRTNPEYVGFMLEQLSALFPQHLYHADQPCPTPKIPPEQVVSQSCKCCGLGEGVHVCEHETAVTDVMVLDNMVEALYGYRSPLMLKACLRGLLNKFGFTREQQRKEASK